LIRAAQAHVIGDGAVEQTDVRAVQHVFVGKQIGGAAFHARGDFFIRQRRAQPGGLLKNLFPWDNCQSSDRDLSATGKAEEAATARGEWTEPRSEVSRKIELLLRELEAGAGG